MARGSSNNKLLRAALAKFVKGKKRTRPGRPRGRVSSKPGTHSTNTTPATNVKTTSKKLRKDPPAVFNGGSYKDLKAPPDYKKNIPGTEINHIPPEATMKNIPGWTRDNGGAIQMDYVDHRRVRSTGYSNDSQAHREHQERLIQNGQIKDAIALDIQDIKRRYGNRYDDALREMIDKGYPDYSDLKNML